MPCHKLTKISGLNFSEPKNSKLKQTKTPQGNSEIMKPIICRVSAWITYDHSYIKPYADVPKCASSYKAIIMTGRACCIKIVHIHYAHPDVMGHQQLVCFLSLHSSAILIILYAIMVAWALFGFLKQRLTLHSCVQGRHFS